VRTFVTIGALLALALSCGGEAKKADPAENKAAATKKKDDAKAPPKKKKEANVEHIVLDAAYAEKHGYELPVRIEFDAPAENLRVTSPDAEQRVFLRLDLATAEGRSAEDLSFTSFRVPAGDAAQRAAFAREIVEGQGLDRALPGGEGKKLGVKQVEVGGKVGLFGAAEFQTENSGTVYATMIAVIMPLSEDSFAMIGHHVVGVSAVKKEDQIGTRGLLKHVLDTIKIEPAG
jgi:hypothetical protein